MTAIACGFWDCLNPIEWATIALAVGLALLWLSIKVALYTRVNARRRGSGMEPVPWRTIARTHLRAHAIAAPDGDDRLRGEAERERARAWARKQGYAEIVRHGRPVSWHWCRAHRRWCFIPAGGDHPPGGTDPPPVPDEYRPWG